MYHPSVEKAKESLNYRAKTKLLKSNEGLELKPNCKAVYKDVLGKVKLGQLEIGMKWGQLLKLRIDCERLKF